MCPMTMVGSGTEFYGKQCFLSTSNIAPLPPKKQTKGNTIKKKNKQIKQTKQTTPPTTTTKKKTIFPFSTRLYLVSQKSCSNQQKVKGPGPAPCLKMIDRYIPV